MSSIPINQLPAGNHALLCRPAILADEWFTSYVLRLALENGCKATSGYYVRRIDTCTRQTIAASIVKQHSVDHGRPGMPPHFGELGLPEWAVRSAGGMVPHCPQCFKDQHYVPMLWRLTDYQSCFKHGCALVDFCRECGRRITAPHLFAGQCDCGCKLLPKSSGISPVAARWCAKVWTEVDELIRDGATLANAEATSRLRLLELLLVARLMRLCATRGTMHWPYRTHPLPDRHAQIAIEYGMLDSEEPVGIWALLHGAQSVFDKSVLWAEISRIQREAQSQGTDFALLPLDDYLGIRSLSGATIQATKRGERQGSNTRSGFTIVRVSEMLNTSLPTIKALLAEGVVSPATSTLKGRVTHYHFSSEEVEALRQQLSRPKAIDWKSETGLDPACAKKFLQTKTVRLIVGKIKYELFDQQDFQAFVHSLEMMASPHQEDNNSEWMSLASPALWVCHTTAQMRALLQELRAGAYPLRSLRNGVGLARFFVPITVLLHLRRQGKAIKHEPESSLDLFTDVSAAQSNLFDAPELQVST